MRDNFLLRLSAYSKENYMLQLKTMPFTYKPFYKHDVILKIVLHELLNEFFNLPPLCGVTKFSLSSVI